jgi:hypothetical protein
MRAIGYRRSIEGICRQGLGLSAECMYGMNMTVMMYVK